MNDNKWLESLKVGDEVAIVSSGGWSRMYRFARVERLTNTQIIVAGTRFKRRNGEEVGHGYRGDSLEEATAELKAEVEAERKRNNALALLRDVRWRDLNNETMLAVAELVRKAQEVKGEAVNV